MRKVVILIIVLICTIVSLFSNKDINNDCYEVIKVNSSADFYIDLNNNKTFEQSERVILYDMHSKNKLLSDEDRARLEYLSKKYSESILLNQKVCIKDRTKYQDLTLPNGKNYLQLLYENGYILSDQNKDKVKQNINNTKSLDLVSYHPYSHKYHKLNCKHAFGSQNTTLILKSDLPPKAEPCKVCHNFKTTSQNSKSATPNNKNSKYPREYFEKYSPIYKDNYLEFYITDFTKQYYAVPKCLTTACQSLLREINSAQKTIDFAIYGIDKQPEITNALINANKRGVKIRWVYDTDKNGNTIYKESFDLQKHLNSAKSDTMLANGGLNANGKKIKDSIMHNKFFIFDSQKVWTGSANIAYTDLSGFNANSAILIKSPDIAAIYTKEFEQMYNGKFHQLKEKTPENSTTIGTTKISVYFSPQDKAISKHLVPLINNAQKYIYIPVFVITHKDFVQALINAKNRGVDVRLIVDATSAASPTSAVKILREAGINVKTENRAGKMHMKSIIIDDKFSIIGSMNFTKSGEFYNDENVIIINNANLAQNFKSKFLYFYNDIPEKWLTKNPGAESFNSINSCFDGVDNDFDGKIDSHDEGCQFTKK